MRLVVLWGVSLIPAMQSEFAHVDVLQTGLATAGPAPKDGLEHKDCLGQRQAGRGAFGSRRSSVRKACAVVTRAAW